jgi:pimeloyl-ACP methyl ester carboxylesterase/AraC-like DNA-binding protein
MHSEIQYTRSTNVRIAYQKLGTGTQVIILVNGWVSNLEEVWLLPGVAEWLSDLASFSQLILFDKRGVGLSDRVPEEELPGVDERMDDLRAIMDQEGIAKASLFGFSEGGSLAVSFAAAYPERVDKLILYGSYARWTQSPDYPIGIPPAVHEKTLAEIDAHWGKPIGLPLMAPSVASDPVYQKAWAAFLRKSASPSAARALYQMNLSLDVRHLLSRVRVPTLVMHREEDKLIPFSMGEYLAEHIPGAQLTRIPGRDHFPWIGDTCAIIASITIFLDAPFSIQHTRTTLGTLVAVEPTAAYSFQSLARVFSQCGCTMYQTRNDLFIGIFDEPAAALHCAASMLEHMPEDVLKILIHSGVYNRKGTQLEGPAVALLSRVMPLIHSPQIWITQAIYSLLPKTEFRLTFAQEISVPGHPFPLALYTYQHQLAMNHHFDWYRQHGKLKEEDIRTLMDVRQHLEMHYLETFTLKQISRTFGINSFKLKYGFKALFGISVMQFVQDLKLEYAHQLIKNTDTLISDIADEMGYQHAGNFSKAFSRKFGKNPLELRRHTLKSVA